MYNPLTLIANPHMVHPGRCPGKCYVAPSGLDNDYHRDPSVRGRCPRLVYDAPSGLHHWVLLITDLSETHIANAYESIFIYQHLQMTYL